MELFEILFILMFILIPLFEGIRKSRQRRQETGEAAPMDRAETGWDMDSEPHPPEPAGQASDMLPDDLWEVLTGERRSRPPVAAEPDIEEEQEEETAPWRTEPAGSIEAEEPVLVRRTAPEPIPIPTAPARTPRAPLRPPPREPLRRPLRELPGAIGAAVTPPATARRPLVQALRTSQGVRDAIVLAEIIGPPRSAAPLSRY